MERSRPKSNTRVISILATVLIVGGTVGFVLLKGESLGDALYQTVLVLSTHFYHVIDESLSVRLLILGLIIGGIILVAYLIKWFVEYIIEGEFQGGFARRRMNNKINSLSGHYIITGFGRVGRQVAEELAGDGVPFVITDRDPEKLEYAKAHGWLFVEGSATSDQVLEEAGVREAKALVVATGSDADNVFITLGARSLNPRLFIVARANAQAATDKLKKAGANRVAMPHRIGGYHMATMAVRPAVVDFLDVLVDSRDRKFQVEEILVGPQSPMVGYPLETHLSRSKSGTTVLAINRPGRDPIINPDGNDLVTAGDRLIVMGTRDQLQAIARMG